MFPLWEQETLARVSAMLKIVNIVDPILFQARLDPGSLAYLLRVPSALGREGSSALAIHYIHYAESALTAPAPAVSTRTSPARAH